MINSCFKTEYNKVLSPHQVQSKTPKSVDGKLLGFITLT